jgi:hypothetical protein
VAEILGVGLTHQPTLATGLPRPSSLRRTLKDPGLPEHLRTPSGWPSAMVAEWSDDDGAAHGRLHRDAIMAKLRTVRETIDAFAPDLVVVWGDDQYENFHDDVVPAFCVLAYDEVVFKPWHARSDPNHWNEDREQTFTLRGHRAAAKYLATSLLEASFDVAYAYRPLHAQLGHAFGNTLLYLDWDRTGFTYPIVPVSLNCYGRRLVSQRGYLADLGNPLTPDRFDPPSPSPARCFDFGAAVARAFAASPWRVALVASSSWSHAFLTEKHWYLYPDHESDRELYQALIEGNYGLWRARTLAQIEDSGQQELLNWFCLAGAMTELGQRTQDAEYFESSVMNSNKVIGTFPPVQGAAAR